MRGKGSFTSVERPSSSRITSISETGPSCAGAAGVLLGALSAITRAGRGAAVAGAGAGVGAGAGLRVRSTTLSAHCFWGSSSISSFRGPILANHSDTRGLKSSSQPRVSRRMKHKVSRRPKRLLPQAVRKAPQRPPRPPPNAVSGPKSPAVQDRIRDRTNAPESTTAVVLSSECFHLPSNRRAEAAARMTISAKLPRPKQSQIRKRPSRKPSLPDPLWTGVEGDRLSGAVRRLWSAFQVKR